MGLDPDGAARDLIERGMSPAQVAEAERRARAWLAAHRGRGPR